MAIITTEDVIQAQRDMLLATGLWPLENKTWKYELRTVISWVATLGLCLSMWIEFFNDIHDIIKLSGIVYILISFMNAIVKQIGFISNHKTLQETLNHLKNPIFLAHSEDLDHYMGDSVKFSVKLAKVSQILLVSFVIMLGIIPIIDKKPLPFLFLYDVGNYTFIIYIFQMFCEFVSGWNHLCLDSICISLLCLASAQLDILADKIVQINILSQFYGEHNKRDEVVLQQLKHCVDHHLAIIKLIENIEQIFSVGILSQYLASSLVICNTIFNFISVPPSFQFFILTEYLICILIQLFIYCWFGNKILIKSIQVGDACYTFNWYDYGVPVRKYIFIIMERSKRPLCITALKFTSISIESLTTVLQWSYSILTLLLNVYQKKSTIN